jgi:hypothetical protein
MSSKIDLQKKLEEIKVKCIKSFKDCGYIFEVNKEYKFDADKKLLEFLKEKINKNYLQEIKN